MAFVEIQRGNDKKTVSFSSFKNFFENAGWKVAGENPATSIPTKKEVKKEKKQVKEEKVEEKVDPVKDEWDEVLNEEVEEEGIEKPISEMTRKELIKYAEEHGISLVGLNNVNQFRNAIQDYMKEV